MSAQKLSLVNANLPRREKESGFFLPTVKKDAIPDTLRGVPAPSVPPLLPPKATAESQAREQCIRLEEALHSAEKDLRAAECALLEQEARTAECEKMIRHMQKELNEAAGVARNSNRNTIALEEALRRDADGIRFAVDALLQVLEGRLPPDAG